MFTLLYQRKSFNFTALSMEIFRKLLKIQLKLINETIYKVGIFYNAAGLPQSVFKYPKTDWNKNKKNNPMANKQYIHIFLIW